jgi:hypothetical protein
MKPYKLHVLMDSGGTASHRGWARLCIGFIDVLLLQIIVQRRRSAMSDCIRLRRARSRRKILVIALLLVSVALSNNAAWALQKLPVAQITDVQAPSSVLPDEDFVVTVTVDYSERYSTDIAILDKATNFVLASKGLIIPSGRNVFTFHLTGRERAGIWLLVAAVRVWWHDGWYTNEKGATFPFAITVPDPTSITLLLTSNIASSTATIDGIPHRLTSQGVHIPTTRGFHTIEIEAILAQGNGTRAVFDHWSDGIRGSSRRVYLTGSLDLSAIYLTQYYLVVESSVGRTVGSGWYIAGTNATFAIIDSFLVGRSSTGRESRGFTHWSGDSDSNSPVAWLLMDEPRTVIANWSEGDSSRTLTTELAIASMICLSCSAFLVAAGVTLRRRVHTGRRRILLQGKAHARAALLMLVFLLAIMHSSTVRPAQASIPIQPESVTIGDATWYHWNQVASDTLLIWLGGGIVEQTSFLVNPYEFESYNTIRFIQDLAEHYDVLALGKGSIRSADSTLNRTIFQEPYPGSYNFIKKIQSWAHEQGYAYLYVVGYSVGAMVAAKELIVVSPEDWASPNGLVIITTKIVQGVSSQAKSLRASLLLLYGDRIGPEFTTSGQAFYGNAPEEGWLDGSWYHREYHVIPDVEHEVWTIMDSGEYDSRAALITINFIERCKSLQFERMREPISKAALNDTTNTGKYSSFNATIVSVHSPSRVETRKAFGVAAQLRYDVPSNTTLAVLAFDTDAMSVVSVAQKQLSGKGETYLLTTVLSGENPRTIHLSLISLIQTGDNWNIVGDGQRDVSIDVTDQFSARVIVGYPDVVVGFDGQTLRTGLSGEITVNATQGEHIISVPPVITVESTVRAAFEQWNVTSTSSTIQLSITRDVSLLAIYRKQYYLNVTSPLGQASGAGWYDESSTATFRVTPPIVTDKVTHVFIGWLGDSNDPSPSSSVLVNGSKNIQASWEDIKPAGNSADILRLQVLLVASLLILFGSIAFLVISLRHRRSSPLTDVLSLST